MEKGRLLDILKFGTMAPSGDNMQPWSFEWDGVTLTVFLLKEADISMYNHAEYGSSLAVGAVIQNIIIAAAKFGFEAKVQYSTDPLEEGWASKITFISVHASAGELFDAIPQRATNRTVYDARVLKQEVISVLEETVKNFENMQFAFSTSVNEIKILSEAISLNERLFLENEQIHDGLFSTITWTKEDDERIRKGLFVNTLELKPPQIAAFKVFSRWKALKMLNFLGVSRMLPKETAKLYRSSGLIGAIVIQSPDRKTFLQAGRTIEQFWLTGTHLGINFAPVTAVPYLALRIREKETAGISRHHQELILAADSIIRSTLKISSGEIAMLFRMGYGPKPSARSVRIPVEEKLKFT